MEPKKLFIPPEQLGTHMCPVCKGSEWFLPVDCMQFKEDKLNPPPKGNLMVTTMMAVECAKCKALLKHNKDGALEEFFGGQNV